MTPIPTSSPTPLDSATLVAEKVGNLAKTPLGVMALALILIGSSFRYIPQVDVRNQLTIFALLIVTFVLIFGAFCWILVRHGDKLIPPPSRYVSRLLRRAAEDRNLPGRSYAPKVSPEILSRRIPEILWVDDNPNNNELEYRALAAMGLRITQVRSTEDALIHVERKPYALIISDMERDQKPLEGYALLQKLRSVNCQTPFVVYTSTSTAKDKQNVLAEGGQGHTNDPRELLQLVMCELVHGTSRPSRAAALEKAAKVPR